MKSRRLIVMFETPSRALWAQAAALFHPGPWTRSRAGYAARPHDPWPIAVVVGLAPLAEEYMFRALLFKSLRREWGVGRYAWIPIALVGAASALVFRRFGHLAPSVALHMAYNAVVVAFL
jgi:membrane protease YdiL (CAAX protease family)